ncbi:MAG: ASCH domain-containing protein [Gemmataceae bacterium]
MSTSQLVHVLSIKQPWATLLVHGLKTIEVRSWATRRRGNVLVHAARLPDRRPQGWEKLPKRLRGEANQVGGIVGAGNLVDCKSYRDRRSFGADRRRHHLNDPDWFEEPGLFGFVFEDLNVRPFCPCIGAVRFFTIEEPGG